MAKSRLLLDQVTALERYEAVVPEKDAVHEMRVAARRLRAALRLLRLRKLDPKVKALQDALGEVRDLQLQIDWLQDRDAALGRSRRARLRKAEEALRRELRTWHSRTLPAILEAIAASSPPTSRTLSKVLHKRLNRLQERLQRARTRPTPAALHRVRISAKQVRYLLELTHDSLPAKAKRLQSDLKTLQTVLGELHDVDVRIGLVSGKPVLLREQEETRKRLRKIAEAQLARWHEQHLVQRVDSALR
jgi:CHAD domain-containing protein